MIVSLLARRAPATRRFALLVFGLAALVMQALPAAAQNAGPCERITNACRDAGYVFRSAEPGNGLMIDCVQPIMQDKRPPANAKHPLPSISPRTIEACLTANPDFGQGGAARPARVDDDDEYTFNGDTYGWYDDGWDGPGWYIVGSEFRRGVGFGGREGWRGLKHRGSHAHRGGGKRQAGGGGGRRHAGGRGGRRHAGGGGGRRHAGRGGGGRRHAGGGRRGGGHHAGGGGGRRHAGRGGGGRRGGGGHRGGGRRRSDIRLKHDIVMLGHLDNGVGFYRFSYNGSDKAYVGVMAQEVQGVMPGAVVRGKDGYLLVNYDRLGIRMQSWEDWVASGQRIPSTAQN